MGWNHGGESYNLWRMYRSEIRRSQRNPSKYLQLGSKGSDAPEEILEQAEKHRKI